MSVWGEASVQSELDTVARDRVVFERIARQLEELGYEQMWQQCRTKMKNLTQKYRKVAILVLVVYANWSEHYILLKYSNRVSGMSRKTCPFYDEVDAILGTRAASTPAVLLESGSHSSAVDLEDTEPLESSDETNLSEGIYAP